jgi:hypothetical protein
MHIAARVLVVAGAVFAGVAACGGQEFVAGADGGSTAGGDGGACVTAPPSTGSEGAFCDLEAKLFTACGQCEACRQTDLNDCASLGADLSVAFKSALGACQGPGQIPCGDYSTYGSAPCVAGGLATNAHSATQTAAATAYCGRCGGAAGATSCDAGFFQPPQSDGGAAGPGYMVLLASDAIVSSITTSCSTVCGGLYAACAVVQFCKTQQPDACKTGYCGK